jgi:hypothetical protein
MNRWGDSEPRRRSGKAKKTLSNGMDRKRPPGTHDLNQNHKTRATFAPNEPTLLDETKKGCRNTAQPISENPPTHLEEGALSALGARQATKTRETGAPHDERHRNDLPPSERGTRRERTTQTQRRLGSQPDRENENLYQRGIGSNQTSKRDPNQQLVPKCPSLDHK